MLIRIAGVVDESVVDGPGFRLAVFAQGCARACPGCHNPQSWALDGGKLVDIGEIIAKMDNRLLKGLTLTGGEPFLQPEACAALAEAARGRGLDVWAFTGYTFEELAAMPACLPLLRLCDVLVDGPFIVSQKTLEKKFRGSANQRMLDVGRSLAQSRAVPVEGEDA